VTEDAFTDSSPDYVWHFKLSGDEQDGHENDALTEMLRRQLQAILGCVVLTGGDADLRITGFRFLCEPETEHALFPEGASALHAFDKADSEGAEHG
jgi:hypothetical protein